MQKIQKIISYQKLDKLLPYLYPDSKSVRWDIGIKKNDVITPNFDPMLAKIIAYGETRKQATSLLKKELQNTHLAGIRTNKEFLIKCLENSSFKRGKNNI